MANQEPQCPRCREFGHTYGTCPEYQWAMKRTEELKANPNCKEFKELRKRLKELIAKGSKKVVDEQVRKQERDQRRERLRERQQEHPDRDPKRRSSNHNDQLRTQDSSTTETPEAGGEQSMVPTAQRGLTSQPARSTSPLQPQETSSSSTEQNPALSPTPAPTTTPSPGLTSPTWSPPSTPQPYNSSTPTARPRWHFSNGIPPPRHYDAIVGGCPAWYEPYVPPALDEDWNLIPSSRTPTYWERRDRDGERERRSASPSPEERGSGGRRRGYRRRGPG